MVMDYGVDKPSLGGTRWGRRERRANELKTGEAEI